MLAPAPESGPCRRTAAGPRVPASNVWLSGSSAAHFASAALQTAQLAHPCTLANSAPRPPTPPTLISEGSALLTTACLSASLSLSTCSTSRLVSRPPFSSILRQRRGWALKFRTAGHGCSGAPALWQASCDQRHCCPCKGSPAAQAGKRPQLSAVHAALTFSSQARAALVIYRPFAAGCRGGDPGAEVLQPTQGATLQGGQAERGRSAAGAPGQQGSNEQFETRLLGFLAECLVLPACSMSPRFESLPGPLICRPRHAARITLVSG